MTNPALKTAWVALILLFSYACQDTEAGKPAAPENPGPKGIDVEQIVQRGKLVVLLDNNPSGYFIYKGRPMGFYYELLSRFAKFLQVDLEVQIVHDIYDQLDKIVEKQADIAASGLTVTASRKKLVDFSDPVMRTRQVLIQRVPEKGEDRKLIKNVTELAGKTVYVKKGSSFEKRLEHLQEEIGDSIHIVTYPDSLSADDIMILISTDSIEYSVNDEYVAAFYMKYYSNIDIGTPVSLEQNIAWAIPKNSPSLLDTLNYWIAKNKHSTTWAVLYNRYFKANYHIRRKVQSNFALSKNGRISVYDHIIKKYANDIGWDWLLLAAVISTESEFNADTIAWSGAVGLMQIIPSTAGDYGIHPEALLNPDTNIYVGTKYLKRLYNHWKEELPDSTEAIKFALASYNVGIGHVLDARRLAEKEGLDPDKWDGNVATMLLNLSNKLYYTDPVVKHGYCRGREGFEYVRKIFQLYANYKNFA